MSTAQRDFCPFARCSFFVLYGSPLYPLFSCARHARTLQRFCTFCFHNLHSFLCKKNIINKIEGFLAEPFSEIGAKTLDISPKTLDISPKTLDFFQNISHVFKEMSYIFGSPCPGSLEKTAFAPQKSISSRCKMNGKKPHR